MITPEAVSSREIPGAARVCALLVLAVLLAVISPALQAQPSCSVPQVGNRQTRRCTVTLTTTLQLAASAQLSLSNSVTSIFNAGAFGTSGGFAAAGETGLKFTGPTLRVSATRAIRVTMINAPSFSGPVPKSASDVSLGISPLANVCNGVAMIPLSTLPLAAQQAAPRVLVQSDTPGDAVVRQLCFDVTWRYESDPPGNYTLPMTFSITAP